jgi:anti-sigma factor RsiW
MADQYTARLDVYLDGELSTAEMRDLDAHLRGCPSCAADVLARVQMKRALQTAGKRFAPSGDLRARVERSIAKRRPVFRPNWILIPALLLFLIAAGVFLSRSTSGRADNQIYGELADLHVATLASANPVDVVSTDRHTVKPWFQGKIPFTFNLPELANSDFSLLGGRLAYVGQAPAAQLIYQIRKHEISVFIFQDKTATGRGLPMQQKRLSFNVENWSKDGLSYFAIGDASGDDIHRLAELLKNAS